jgi:hypothetical protein
LTRGKPFVSATLLCVAAFFLPLAGTASGSSSDAYIKSYANIVKRVQYSLTPEAVQGTSDGGSIASALSESSNGDGVSWLVKADSSGVPQWHEEIGCFAVPPGDFADVTSAQQTTDNGFVLGGGTIGCGSTGGCPPASGIECALVEKLDQGGSPSWAFVYPAGAVRSSLNKIAQAADNGYVAVGSVTNAEQNTGALVLKLDDQGVVQWQRSVGPEGSTQAQFESVQPNSDGGYVATGEFYRPSAGSPLTSLLVVKFRSNGNVQWTRAYNDVNSEGSPTNAQHAQTVIQTADGGYLIGGHWSDSTSPGSCCTGALLLKLNSSGRIQWQKAYSGGVYCFENGFSETCTDIGGLVYSVQQVADGGYVLAGAGDLELNDSVPLVPWLAKVDASGTLVWQHFYYETNKATGRPLSQYFPSSALTLEGGSLALGFTESPSNSKGELFGVKTDSTGLVGNCAEVHDATPLDEVNPGLARLVQALPVSRTNATRVGSPASVVTTSIATRSDC